MELVCPAGNQPSLKAALENGADAVYLGLKDATNARHFPGLNFNESNIGQAIDQVHRAGARMLMALNTYPQAHNWSAWQRGVDIAADMGADALIAADIGVLDYASRRHPKLNLHLSVQGSATNYEALRFYAENFGIKRAVLPRVLSMAQVRHVIENSPVEIETFGFGSLCVMVEGRCLLSSFAAGQSPNTFGACSPAEHVEWRETPVGLETRLGGILIERYQPNERAGYPTICKGRFDVGGHRYHAIEDPTSLNTLDILPELFEMGVAAIKLEGRQRSPAYIGQVTRVWRQAIDAAKANPKGFASRSDWQAVLAKVSEGSQTTLGALHRAWQ